MNIDEQKQLGRGIADLLARLNPETEPLLRLQLAYWLVRRLARHPRDGYQLRNNLEPDLASSNSEFQI